VIAIQWAFLINGFIHELFKTGVAHKVGLDLSKMVGADFSAAAVLISFGALLGRTSPQQLFLITIVEIVVMAVNESIIILTLGASDIGGSMVIHAFGAYFGLAASAALGNKFLKSPLPHSNTPQTSRSHSLFSLIGTIFLWLFWPSFNAALAVGADRHRTIINTLLSVCASAMTAFAFSRLLRGGKFEMEDVQNATLAGGVAIGASANFVLLPWAAMLVGAIGGMVSTIGFAKLTPVLASWGISDTCGVNNLHGMPGIFAGIVSSIAAAVASDELYGGYAGAAATLFPKMAAPELRTASAQGGVQILSLLITLGMAIVGGYITGYIASFSIFSPPSSHLFNDEAVWHMEHLDEPVYAPTVKSTEEASSLRARATPAPEGGMVELASASVHEEHIVVKSATNASGMSP
jgi:ammonium transporter Rh